MKIQALIGIPIALFGVKWLQNQVVNEKPEDITPLILTEGQLEEYRDEIHRRKEAGR